MLSVTWRDVSGRRQKRSSLTLEIQVRGHSRMTELLEPYLSL